MGTETRIVLGDGTRFPQYPAYRAPAPPATTREARIQSEKSQTVMIRDRQPKRRVMQLGEVFDPQAVEKASAAAGPLQIDNSQIRGTRFFNSDEEMTEVKITMMESRCMHLPGELSHRADKTPSFPAREIR
jgi:hypothetical protein